MKKLTLLFILPALFFCTVAEAGNSAAEGSEFASDTSSSGGGIGLAAGIRGGTNGLGLEFALGITDRWSARLGGDYLSFTTKGKWEKYNADLSNKMTLQSGHLLIDWKVDSESDFYISGGVFYSMDQTQIVVTSAQSYNIGSYVVTPEMIGSITIDITSNKVQPYLGIGLGKAVPDDRVSFNIDVGCRYMGSPKIALEGTGLIAPSAGEENTEQIRQNLSGAYLYPVLTFQLNFRLL